MTWVIVNLSRICSNIQNEWGTNVTYYLKKFKNGVSEKLK